MNKKTLSELEAMPSVYIVVVSVVFLPHDGLHQRVSHHSLDTVLARGEMPLPLGAAYDLTRLEPSSTHCLGQ